MRIFDHGASDDLLSPPSGLSHRFLARVDTIVLFFLEDKKQGRPIMTEHQLSLLPFYAGWGIYNQRLVAAIAPLSAEQLALRNTPHHWSIGMYATHIVANRAWWFHARMGEGSDDLTSLELWALGVCEGDVDPLHPAAELVAGLEKTWQMIQQTLARLTPADLFEVFPPLDQAGRVRHAKLVEPALQPFAQMWLDAAARSGAVRPAVSRQQIIWGVLEHDIHHGSEISTILGVHGLPVVELD
jgi:uncharacterized damage-inducible protein DinB